MTTLMQIILVAAGGAAGGLVRFWISGFVGRSVGDAFPWGTLVVNVTGAFAIGILGGFLFWLPDEDGELNALSLALVVGILGSYTTVSSFSFQTLELAHRGARGAAALNIIVSVAGCLAAVTAGFVFARIWFAG